MFRIDDRDKQNIIDRENISAYLLKMIVTFYMVYIYKDIFHIEILC